MSCELVPCPHCGGEASTPTNWGDPSRPIPRCRDCGSESPSPELWNRRTPGPDVARVVAIMREEGEAFAAVVSDAKSNLAATDCVYWLERAAEHMRRYAGWIEAARPPGPDVARLLADLAAARAEAEEARRELDDTLRVLIATRKLAAENLAMTRAEIERLKAARTPRLLAAAKAFARKFRGCGSDEHRELCRAIAEHEAATK